MVKFEDLRITDENKLVIYAHIDERDYFDNVYIDEVIIDSADTFTKTGPSDKPIYRKTYSRPVKIVDTTITPAEIAGTGADFSFGPFFVYIHTVGAPAPNTPCGMDNELTIGVAINLFPIYKEGMRYLKEVYNSCEVPSAFADFILRYKALIMAIRFKDYCQVVKLWKLLFAKRKLHIKGGCGCHGNR